MCPIVLFEAVDPGGEKGNETKIFNYGELVDTSLKQTKNNTVSVDRRTAVNGNH